MSHVNLDQLAAQSEAYCYERFNLGEQDGVRNVIREALTTAYQQGISRVLQDLDYSRVELLREELERLRNLEHVAVTLAREVRGAEAIEGPALRVALGNSNVSVLLHWADCVMACTPTKSAP